VTADDRIDADLPRRLEAAADATDADDALADLLSEAAGTVRDQDLQLDELQSELEETNEGMVALTLELQEAEERYRRLFEDAVEGIYKTTPDGSRYVMVNGSMADALGYDSPDALKRQVTDVGEDVFVDADRFEEYKSAVREAGAVENFEYRVRREDGEVRWLSDNARLTYDDDGAAGFRGGVIDITERKQYEAELEHRNEELEALNRVVRHDISNDMQVIMGWTEALDRHVDEGGRPALDKIATATEHVLEITDVAREYVETLTGEGAPECKPVALDESLSYELDRQRDVHDAATFTVESPIPSVRVTANEMLNSVFRNLFNNAVVHNDSDHPHVDVTFDVRADDVVVHVADDGPGVPDEQKESIFGKGEQSIDSEGTGIGLYLVAEHVDNYGGDVWIEDNDPCGAIFSVALPKADAPSSA